ncbi:metal-dependent hydrolase [Arsukibacterium sp.]|uniref:metal-dependent hydrolase n=1 Tax=Arsukibacterium sp. TaxID=1977258 RepID=UPI002FDA54C9
MAPGSHFLMSWILAQTGRRFQRRERTIVTLAGVSPDIDGLVLFLDGSVSMSGITSEFYVRYHHVLAHNLAFALLAVAAGLLFARAGTKWLTAMLAFLAVHLHIFADVIGSKGADGYQWPINYLYPFSNQLMLTWPGQWQLNAWPNMVIFSTLMLAAIWITRYSGSSPLEVISVRLDKEAHAMVKRYLIREKQ